MKVGLICSAGGHFFELKKLEKAWEGNEVFWVTILSIDTEDLQKKIKCYFAFAPTTRNLINLIKNTYLTIKVITKEKPSVIVSTGGPICIPFFYLALLFGIKTIYIESLTRTKSLSLTGKIVYSVATVFLVQWEGLAKKYKKAIYKGQLTL